MAGDRFNDADAALPPNDPALGVAGGNDAALDLGYTVTVDSFSGPLDLLLYLVRRTELDILEVPLALIVDQFIETVRSWQDADLDVAGDFILMAATLLELKARTIAPPLDEPTDGERDEPTFDPRESLLRSLLAYRRFKEAAQGLDRLEDQRRPLLERQVRENIPEAPPEEGDFELGELDLNMLMTTCERLMARIGGLGPRTVVVDEMPLGTRIAAMLDELAIRDRVTIRELLAGNHSRVVHITTVMATLELTRQRFVEVDQPEQFGDIALRLRTVEEREREPQLPPPEPDGPKRRRRLPLVTFSAPDTAAATTDETVDEATPEEPSESDEVRFLRELEETTRVGAVLAITANVEASFTAHWYALHPELVPVVPVVVAPPVAPPKISVAKKSAPTSTKSVEAVPPTLAEVPAASAAEAAVTAMTSEAVVSAIAEPATLAPTPAASNTVVADAQATAEIPSPPTLADAAAALITVVPAETPVVSTLEPTAVIDPVATETAAIETPDQSPLIAIAETTVDLTPVVTPVVETTAPSLSDALVPATETITDAAPVAPAAVAEAQAEIAPDVVTPTTPIVPVAEPAPAAVERIIPIDEWPVMHALPIAEETPHPLDDLASDDPAEVNARLQGQARSESAETDDDDDDEDEDKHIDPDDLLGDDPALVNAALQAAYAKPPVEPRPVREVTIPTATETTVWTAPVDLGQTAADPDALVTEAEIVAASAAVADVSDTTALTNDRDSFAEPVSAPIVQTLTDAVSTNSAAPVLPVTGQVVPTEFAAEVSTTTVEMPPAIVATTATPVSTEKHPAAQATVIDVIAVVSRSILTAEPTPATAPSVETSNESVITAPVETLAIANEPVPVPTVVDVIAVVSTYTLTADPTPTTAPLHLTATDSVVADEPVTVPTVVDVIAEVATSTVSADPTPTTAPLQLTTTDPVVAAEPVAVPTVVDVIAVVAVVATSTFSADPTPTTAPLVLSEPLVAAAPANLPTPLIPPEPDGPPPPASPPPPPPRFDSPNSTITTLATTTTTAHPMSPPPRSKLWLMIALVAAINLAWAGWTWFAWVPKNVVEIVSAPQSVLDAQGEQAPTLIWRFNLDVVDDLGVNQPPMLVPQITPAIAGRWHWLDRRTLVLDAAQKLPLATTFSAVIAAEPFRTVDGFRLRSTRTDSWSTAALTLSAATVETFDRAGTTIALTFNQAVDPLVIAQELSVELPAGDPVPPPAVPSLPNVTTTTSAAEAAVTATPVSEVPAPVLTATPSSDATTKTASDVATTPTVLNETTAAVTAAPVNDASLPITSTSVTATPITVTPAAPVAPAVRAISTEPATTVRLLIAAPVRGIAKLRLPAGTVGVAGPLGLAQAWEHTVSLQQTLTLEQATIDVPSHGDVRVDVAVSDPRAPRDLLAPVVTVEPAVPVTISTTDAGVSVVGAFVPGQSYRIRTAATWPDEPSSSGHVLSAYTAASSVAVTIPERPTGLWPLDDAVVDGQLRIAAQRVPAATVAVLPNDGNDARASAALSWSSPGDAPALVNVDELTLELPAANYRLRVSAADTTTWEQPLVIEHVLVRPQALLAAVIELAQAVIAGNQLSDVPVRVVRLARTP